MPPRTFLKDLAGSLGAPAAPELSASEPAAGASASVGVSEMWTSVGMPLGSHYNEPPLPTWAWLPQERTSRLRWEVGWVTVQFHLARQLVRTRLPPWRRPVDDPRAIRCVRGRLRLRKAPSVTDAVP